MNLEKEIEKYYYDNFAFISNVHIPTLDILTAIAKHFVEWKKQQDQQTIELAEDHAMLAGMMKEQEQMLKDAVDGEVVSDLKGVNYVRSMSKISDDLRFGKKVKLIIIKEEEQ